MTYLARRRPGELARSFGLGCSTCSVPRASFMGLGSYLGDSGDGLGALSIPDYTLWSSGDISTFYDQILDATSHLETDIAQNVPHSAEGEQLRTDFTNFKRRFLSQWQQYHDSWPAGSSATPVATAREAAGFYNGLETRYRNITGRAPTAPGIAPVAVQSTPSPMVAGLPVWAWAGIGVVGLGMVGWIFMSISRVSSSVSRAVVSHSLLANRRRRRQRRRRS